jgi:hypothetical protein
MTLIHRVLKSESFSWQLHRKPLEAEVRACLGTATRSGWQIHEELSGCRLISRIANRIPWDGEADGPMDAAGAEI